MKLQVSQIELSFSKKVVTVHGTDAKGEENTWDVLSESLIRMLDNPPMGTAVIKNKIPPKGGEGVQIPVRVVKKKKDDLTSVVQRENAKLSPSTK